MPNLDDLLNRASSVAQTATAVAKHAAASAKISIAIAAEEEKVRLAYHTIGRMYHQARISGAPVTGPAFEAQLQRVDAALDRIGELRSQREYSAPGEDDLSVEESYADIAD